MLGNPKGDVTLVEFFDYNCAYCKRALSDMLTLIKSDPNLRIVLKEFPVLGEGSTEAAQVAVAVRMQDESGKKYLEFHQKLLGGRGQADRARALAAAKDAGVDMTRLEKDMAEPRGQSDARGEHQACRKSQPDGHPKLCDRARRRGWRRRRRRTSGKNHCRTQITRFGPNRSGA